MVKVKKKKTGKFNTITSCISTSLVLILLGTATFFIRLSENFGKELRENFTVEVLLDDAITKAERETMAKELATLPYVKEVSYISKEEGTKEMAAVLEGGPQEFLGFNPIPAEFELFLNAEYANSDRIVWIEKEIMANKKVMEVSYPQDLLDSVNRNIRKVSMFLLGLAALLTLISFALINNTIRLAIYSKRFLIHTMKLVGASWGFIRRPFLFRNMWIGILSGVMADAVLMGMAYMLVKYEPQLIEIMTPASLLVVMISVFVFGLVITSLCAYISINKYLRMKASALYYI